MEQRVLFEALFTRLRAEGFALGYDHHLRLYQLLEKVQCKPEELREAICPVLASTPWQQQRFREIFDESFPQFGAAAKRQERRPWWWMGVTALAVSLFLGLLVWMGLEAWDRTRPVPKPTEISKKGDPTPTPLEDRVSFRSQMIDLRSLAVETSTRTNWWQVLAPVVIWLALMWRSGRKRKVVISRGAALPPPHYWPLRVEAAGEKIYPRAVVAGLSRLLRLRVASAMSVLDIRATIQATVRSAGYTTIRRRRLGKAPEYLVLIERRSLNDHFAHLIDDLCELLRGEGVFLERYFFEGDARALVREDGSALRLEDLAGRCAGHRLLVFADSATFVHPVTGKLEGWAERIWPQWEERAALLSDRPIAAIRDELRRAGFVLVPASTGGLREAVNYFNRGGGAEGLAPPQFEPLERPLEQDSDWVKACAIYPELNWNLSLQLAGEGLEEGAVSRLARNDWFRNGSIPPPKRERMRKNLSEAERGAVIKRLRELLAAHPAPPEGSAARAGWDAQLKLFDGTWEGKAEEAKEAIEDVTLLRFLDAETSRAESWGERVARHSLVLRVATGVVAVLLSLSLYFQDAPRRTGLERVDIASEDGSGTDGVMLEVDGLGHNASGPLPASAAGLVVKTVRPQWTKSWRREGNVLKVMVGRGRPSSLPFRLESWTSGMEFSEGSQPYSIGVDYAGQASSVQLDGYGSTELPLNGRKFDWVEETEDGLRLTVRPSRPGKFRWRLTPAKAEEEAGISPECCVTEIKAAATTELPYRLQTDKDRVAPGEEVQFRWTPVAGKGELRLEYGGQRASLKAGTQALGLRPTETQRYRIVEFGKVLSNEVEVRVSSGAAPLITYFRQGRVAGQIEWKVENWNGTVEVLDGSSGRTRVQAQGSLQVSPRDRTTYELRAGSARRQLVVEGVGASKIVSFYAVPLELAASGDVLVVWRVEKRGRDRVYLLIESQQRPQGYVDPEPQEVSAEGRQSVRVNARTRFTIYTEDGNGKRGEGQSAIVQVGGAKLRGQVFLRRLECPAELGADLRKTTLRLTMDSGKEIVIPLEACEKLGQQSYLLGVGTPESTIRIYFDQQQLGTVAPFGIWQNPGVEWTYNFNPSIGKGANFIFKMVFQAQVSMPAMAK